MNLYYEEEVNEEEEWGIITEATRLNSNYFFMLDQH